MLLSEQRLSIKTEDVKKKLYFLFINLTNLFVAESFNIKLLSILVYICTVKHSNIRSVDAPSIRHNL